MASWVGGQGPVPRGRARGAPGRRRGRAPRRGRFVHAAAGIPAGTLRAAGPSAKGGSGVPYSLTGTDECPRCGAQLRFEDDDGTRECVCGWSDRRGDPADEQPPVADPGEGGDDLVP